MCRTPGTGLRHNRCMGSFVRAYLVSVLLLAGCDGAQHATVPLPQLEQAGGRMQWRGQLPCADCDGIDVQLQLVHAADGDAYRLVEVYRLGDDGVRFVERGHWRRDGDLIRIQAQDGSRRTFALQPDRSLRLSDAHGRAVPDRVRYPLRPLSAGAPP